MKPSTGSFCSLEYSNCRALIEGELLDLDALKWAVEVVKPGACLV